ncbi:MAG: thiamine pyrophosphate-binding protein [bacterium]|nr:thiamine pyrophosphate-binding protein [bacterium]
MENTQDAKKEVSVARYLVSKIEELGIDTVPVIQGGAIMKMIDEVGESKKLRYICPNHEQALAMMVDAYARLRGFGVGMATSGPGATNLATGIACAYYDSIPCLFITGQVGMFHVKGSRGVRQRGFQETDVVSVLRPITKFAVLLDKGEDARYVFEKAVHIAKTGRPGPVVIDLPYNVQRQMVDPDALKGYIPEEPEQQNKEEITKETEEVVEKLYRAQKPLLLVGGGVRIAGYEKEIYEFVQKTELPVVTTWSAADIFPPDFPLYLGNIGKSGNASAVKALQESDVLLCLGVRFTPRTIIHEKKFAEQTEVIAVDIDHTELEEGIITPRKKICCDLKEFIPVMIRSAGGKKMEQEDWKKRLEKLKMEEYVIHGSLEHNDEYVDPYRFVPILFEEAPANAVFIPECGANLIWVMQAYKLKKGQRIFSAWGNSPMGYAFPAAIGARLANPNVPVIATIGDGGFQMNIQELQTIVGNNIDIKVFILNNKCYGNIIIGATKEFQGRVHGNNAKTGYTAPDFIKVAKAYGVGTETITNNKEIKEKVRSVLQRKGAVIVDVNINPDQEHVELNL